MYDLGMNFLKSIYYGITLNSKRQFFVVLFNFQSRLLNKNIIVKYLEKKKIFTIKNNNITRFFISERVCVSTYWKGFKNRAEGLGSSYFLGNIQFFDNDLIVDCGAHLGDLAMYFNFNKRVVNYIAFEPSPPEFHCLEMNLKNMGFGTAYNYGLWSENGTIPFFISSKNADSSFIEPTTYTTEVKIPTIRLDTFLDKPIKLLKIEAEGGEPEVIYGCDKLLHQIKFIAIDVGRERGIEKKHTLVEVVNYLLPRNFVMNQFSSPSGRWTILFENNLI